MEVTCPCGSSFTWHSFQGFRVWKHSINLWACPLVQLPWQSHPLSSAWINEWMLVKWVLQLWSWSLWKLFLYCLMCLILAHWFVKMIQDPLICSSSHYLIVQDALQGLFFFFSYLFLCFHSYLLSIQLCDTSLHPFPRPESPPVFFLSLSLWLSFFFILSLLCTLSVQSKFAILHHHNSLSLFCPLSLYLFLSPCSLPPNHKPPYLPFISLDSSSIHPSICGCYK